jgi:hypothetical protein
MLQTLREQAEDRLFAEVSPMRRWVGPIVLRPGFETPG